MFISELFPVDKTTNESSRVKSRSGYTTEVRFDNGETKFFTIRKAPNYATAQEMAEKHFIDLGYDVIPFKTWFDPHIPYKEPEVSSREQSDRRSSDSDDLGLDDDSAQERQNRKDWRASGSKLPFHIWVQRANHPKMIDVKKNKVDELTDGLPD